MRATLMKHRHSPRLPPIQVTIVAGDDDVGIRISDQGSQALCNQLLGRSITAGGGFLSPQIKTPSDLLSFSHVCNAARLDDSRLHGLRLVSSSPSGMKATVDEQIGKKSDDISQSPALHSNKPGTSTAVPGPEIGIGLPMSNIFATYAFLASILSIIEPDERQLLRWITRACIIGWLG
jgi:pyruvate dehydrogenase kinase 2/3/4